MAVYCWVITDMDGELSDGICQINAASTITPFNDCIPPSGYMKTIISHGDYEKLESSFNTERKIYDKHINPATSKVRNLPEARKKINEAKAKPKWLRVYPNGYIETKDKSGKIVATVLTPEF